MAKKKTPEKLFENTEYKKAWESRKQILLRVEAEKQQKGK